MDKDVHVQVNYEKSETLPDGTGLSIEQYDVAGVAEFAKEMKEKGLEGLPKVSLQFEMSTSGLIQLIKAEAAMEELVMVEEEVEVEDDEEGETEDTKKEDNKTDKKEDAKTDDAADDEKKDDASSENKETDGEEKKDVKSEEPKKKKTKKVQKVSAHPTLYLTMTPYWIYISMLHLFDNHLGKKEKACPFSHGFYI